MEGRWEVWDENGEEYGYSVEASRRFEAGILYGQTIASGIKRKDHACLISAAPELLEEVKDLKERYFKAVFWMLDKEHDSEKWPDWMLGCRTALEEADAAIAKATGQSQ